ncbi:MAG TPA: MBL fold metallo-hydrolase [Steroidobacteraceae bacterium]|nr:MBL fold metallo-hydrolase [Steroidobacteraceae bacterium]
MARSGRAAARFAACACLAAASGAGAAESPWCEAAAAAASGLERVDVGSEWFQVYAVAPGVFAISEPRQYEGVNSFLVVGSTRALLFDTGLGVARIGEVVRGLTELPVTVLNSHTHFDHVGGNAEFGDVRNLDAPFSKASARGEVSASIAVYARGTLGEERVCGKLPAGATSRDYRLPTWRATGPVADGERLDIGGRTLEVISTPGHTPDAICLLDRANGLLFTGDTYYSGEIYLWSPETSVKTYIASIDKLSSLVPELKALMPAHGAPRAEPQRLRDLQDAFATIQAGAMVAELAPDDRLLFRFEHFTILMAAPAGPQ